MGSLWRKLGWFINRDKKEAELREELEFHLSEDAEEWTGRGIPAQQALGSARRGLGNLTSILENTRAVWGWTWVEQLVLDLRYGLRGMKNNPAFSALVVLSLALGIGANTAIYSFMDSLLLRTLPVPDPGSLALLNWHSRERSGPQPNHVVHGMDGYTWKDRSGLNSGVFPYGAYELFKEHHEVFSTLFAYYKSEDRNLTIMGQAEMAAGEFVSGEYFRGLSVSPAAGRLLLPDDDRAGAPPVAVISTRLAERRFSSVANAAGQTILIDNLPFTVVGVTPSDFSGVDLAASPDFYLPVHTNLILDRTVSWAATPATYRDPNHYWIEMMGRLRPGVTRAQAQASLAPRFHEWVAATASNERERQSLPALTLKDGAGGVGTLRLRYSEPLYLLLSLAGLILAIACANASNLLLSRAAARRREIAVRLSIGAGRLRLVRQLLTESLLLAAIAGGLGILLAFWGVRFLNFIFGQNSAVQAAVNWHVLGAATLLSLMCGAVFGLAPALQSTRHEAVRTPELDPPARAGFWRIRLSDALMISQLVMSLLLLIAAGLLGETLSNLESVRLGFNRENVLLFEVNARQAGHHDPEILAFYRDLRSRFASISGVRGVTLSHASLLDAGRGLEVRVNGELATDARILNTGPGFFSTMQIPMLMGREIDERDRPDSEGVVVASERFARIYFGNDNPIGRTVKLGGPHPREMEIVGVAANAHYGRLREDTPPVLYIPYNQGDYPRVQQMVYALRTAGNPLTYVSTVREIVHRADSRIPLVNVRTEAAEIDRDMNSEILFARLCTGFALLALTIASVGLYGTVGYAVARRTGEIGIRMALGARRGTVVRMILRQVAGVAAVGIGAGVILALGLSRFIAAFLFGVQHNDPAALTMAVAILLSAALLAGYIPARKASRIDPVAALRRE